MRDNKKKASPRQRQAHARAITPPPPNAHSPTRPLPRPKSTTPQSPSRQSVSEKPSPPRLARKTSAPAIRSKPSPLPSLASSPPKKTGSMGEREGDREQEEQKRHYVDSRLYRAAGVRLCTKFSELNDSERMKRLKIVAERLIKVGACASSCLLPPPLIQYI